MKIITIEVESCPYCNQCYFIFFFGLCVVLLIDSTCDSIGLSVVLAGVSLVDVLVFLFLKTKAKITIAKTASIAKNSISRTPYVMYSYLSPYITKLFILLNTDDIL